MFFVYALKSEVKDYIYVGLTDNMERRFSQHNLGYERTTRPYKPYSLILTESYQTRQEARNREKYLKSGVGKEFLRSIKK
jgi:putative endonuclease